jgi:hypothetical protein
MKSNIKNGKNPNKGCSLRKFQRRGEFYCASVLDKSKMMIKKRFNAPLGADLLVKPFPIFA